MEEVSDTARVLLAEDDDAMRVMLCTVLARSGFEVTPCENGRAMLRELERAEREGHAPDVIVSDVCMPGASGLDVAHASRRVLPEVPLILITAFGDDHTHERAKALGAMAVLNKPFDLRDFRRLVQDAVAATRPLERGEA